MLWPGNNITSFSQSTQHDSQWRNPTSAWGKIGLLVARSTAALSGIPIKWIKKSEFFPNFRKPLFGPPLRMGNCWGVPKGSFKLRAYFWLYWKFGHRQLSNLVNLQRSGGSGKPHFWPPLRMGNCWGIPKGSFKLCAYFSEKIRNFWNILPISSSIPDSEPFKYFFSIDIKIFFQIDSKYFWQLFSFK